MAGEWYYEREGQQTGPVSAADLKKLAGEGTLTPETLVWKSGLKEWTPASRVKGLFPSETTGTASAAATTADAAVSAPAPTPAPAPATPTAPAGGEGGTGSAAGGGGVEQTAGAAEGKSGGFFGSLKRGMKKAGSTAKKYGRLGAAKVELETGKSKLKTFHARLGEKVFTLWAEDSERALTGKSKELTLLLDDVREAREEIAEIKERIELLREQEKQ